MSQPADRHQAIHYDHGAYAELYALEAGNFWFRGRNRLIFWALERFSATPAGRFLEIGCGTGFVLSGLEARFPQLVLHGSEVLEAGLAYARERIGRAELFQLDARAIAVTEPYDAIGAFDVLEHIEEDRAVLAQIFAALKPGGLMLLTVPQHPSLWSPADDFACHVRRYTRRELTEKITTAGFAIEANTSFVTFLLPLMAASRWLQRWRGSPYDLKGELALNPLVNAIFERTLDLERWLIARGARLPLGGSRLVVARKPREAHP